MKLLYFLTAALFSVAMISSIGCNNDPLIVTETITDTLYITQVDTTTTFVLVRHADREGSQDALSAAGVARANDLTRVMQHVDLTEIFSTDFNRTKDTAAPVAADHDLTTLIYDPNDLTTFVDEVLDQYLGKIVLIVGHSNTTPDLLNILTGTSEYDDIPELEYNNLYVASTLEKGRTEVVHMKYGD